MKVTAIAIAECAGQGSVCQIKEYRRLKRDYGAGFTAGLDGKQILVAVESDIDLDTNERVVIRTKAVKNNTEAKDVCRKWQAEYTKKAMRLTELARTDAVPRPPDAHCDALTPTDKQDAQTARINALRRFWPNCFGIFDQPCRGPIKPTELDDAYLLDLASQGIPPSKVVRPEIALIHALSKAAKLSARRGKSRVSDAARYLIAFNWIHKKWCYKKDAETALILKDELQRRFTAEQVKKIRTRLGLVSKRKPGPSLTAYLSNSIGDK